VAFLFIIYSLIHHLWCTEGADVGVQLALVTLNQAVKRADPATKVAAEQREYHKILAKFNKTIEKVPRRPPPPVVIPSHAKSSPTPWCSNSQ
jgi:hypothetical protein